MDRLPASMLAAVALSVPAANSVVSARVNDSPVEVAQTIGDEDPLQTFRAPLLREGSMLVEAQAVLRREGEPAWWVLHVEPRDASVASVGGESDVVAATPARPVAASELIALPCTRLSEMERIIESASAHEAREVRFKVSGRVFVFRDRNYFLPTHAVVVSAESATAPAQSNSTTQASPASTPSTSTDAPAPSAPAEDDSVEAIARALEKQTGPIARSSATTRASDADRSTATRNGASTDAAASSRSATMQENTAVVNRRGKITRDRSGGWLMVFDADASGLADPPLKLMPCMLLENIEDYARRVGNNSPIIVTGQVYLYNGQNHLLPTVYRIPRETSRLTP